MTRDNQEQSPETNDKPPGGGKPFPPKKPVGIALKTLGALLMLLSILGVLFFAWYFDTLGVGPALLLLLWVGGFILFVIGRQAE